MITSEEAERRAQIRHRKDLGERERFAVLQAVVSGEMGVTWHSYLERLEAALDALLR